MVTKEDILDMTTRDDLKTLEAKMATKDELKALEAKVTTKDELKALEAKVATKDELKDVYKRQAPSRTSTIPTRYMVADTHHASAKNAPANRAMTGILAPQGMKGVSIAVVLRSLSFRIVLEAITPGMAHPVPITIGMTDFPERPTLLKIGSSTTVARAI